MQEERLSDPSTSELYTEALQREVQGEREAHYAVTLLSVVSL